MNQKTKENTRFAQRPDYDKAGWVEFKERVVAAAESRSQPQSLAVTHLISDTKG